MKKISSMAVIAVIAVAAFGLFGLIFQDGQLAFSEPDDCLRVENYLRNAGLSEDEISATLSNMGCI